MAGLGVWDAGTYGISVLLCVAFDVQGGSLTTGANQPMGDHNSTRVQWVRRSAVLRLE